MRVLIAAGGTAGHINPALAIASYLKKQHPSIVIAFAGRRTGMEHKLVTGQGYPFYEIEVTGIQRSLSHKAIVRNVKMLYNLALSTPRAKEIINEFKPDLVIGAGGYVSGPVVRLAAKMGIKTAIHEQNAFPGITNKLLAKDVDVVLAAVPDAVERLNAVVKTTVVGNPVREEVFVADRIAARRAIGAKDGQVVIVSFGGSLGAQKINENIARLAKWHLANREFLHIHATGSIEKLDFAVLAKQMHIDNNPNFVIKEYINDMPAMLAAADLVISRAGALTLAEIAASGKASLLIPSPNVAENHQYYNALSLVKLDAARVLQEKDITQESFINTVDELTKSPELLCQMGQRAKSLAARDSLEKIYIRLKPLLLKG